MKKRFLILSLLIQFSICATLTGKVSDSRDAEILIGASVYLEGTEFGINSDIDGNYILFDVPNGEYTVIVKYIGYEDFKKNITINKDTRIVENFMLSPSSIEVESEKIIGNIERKDKITNAPATKEIISSDRIKVESATNLGSYLKGMKGVDYTASGMDSYSISVRGFNSSFSSRLLTLTDGRVANIPALRVVSYNTIPQSQDDIEKMEVILGPATALYGANAHSGVVNIVSKPPATSEGLSIHFSGSEDERQLRKINGRFAKKLNNHVSFKMSASYLHAYEWEFMSEDEWKSHQFAWVSAPNRQIDGKDNNPWNDPPLSSEDWDGTKRNYSGEDGQGNINGWNIDNYWFDENDDGIFQEDEFINYTGIADPSEWDTKVKFWWKDCGLDRLCVGDLGYQGIDEGENDGIAQTEEIYIIGNGEANHGDLDGDGVAGEDWANGYDDDGDGRIDEDYFEADGIDNDGDCPGDTNNDGIECGPGDVGVDENIDGVWDVSFDAADNNGNGLIDERYEYDSNGNGVNDWGEDLDSKKIIIYDGRIKEYINGEQNIWYDEEITDPHIRGDYIWDEENFTILFDTFYKDYGDDGIAGDLHEDVAGNGLHEPGENHYFDDFGFYIHNDCGLDGLCENDPGYPGPDEGENDGIWNPGDGWNDTNGNGVIDPPDENQIYDSWVETEAGANNPDLWPLADGVWNDNEIIYDCGQDGLCAGDVGYPGPDPGEDDGNIIALDNGELDGTFDTGDGCFGCDGDITDEQFRAEQDTNGDNLNDYPDFELDNRKVEARIDIDGVPFWGLDDLNLTFQSGYSWSKSQVVTGVGRYLLDGWEYTFNQFKANYNNWFFQTYINKSYSGDTRGYLRGDIIQDYSNNIAYQLQNNFEIKPILNNWIADTKVIWGIDYSKTMPVTNGTILNDGPNGRDEDGDGIIDEEDEFDNPLAKEVGLYFQTTSKLARRDDLELITAARLDYHDQLEEDEGIQLFGKKWQFGPKFGLMYNPSPKHSWRITFGRAFNTPTTTSLFTNYFVQKYRIFDVYLRGNKDGTDYVRVDENTNVVPPTYYGSDGNQYTCGNYNFDVDTNNDGYIDEDDTGYIDRIQDMPYFFLYNPMPGVPADWIPLDTSNFLVYIPEPNGDGHIIEPSDVKQGERYIPDVPSIKSEKINSFEIGYKTIIANAMISADFYVNHYADFFSPATYITPTVIHRYNDDGSKATVDNFSFAGFIPGNQNNSNPPYGTGWNGIDDDGDWTVWASRFGWDEDDKNEDGDPRDPGEWGFIYVDPEGECNLNTGTGCTIYHPSELQFDGIQLGTTFQGGDSDAGINTSLLIPVGIDEWSPTTGMSEFESSSSLVGENQNTYPTNADSVEGRATSPPEIILGVLNYGNVWTQGIDIAFTQIFSPKLALTGNFSWYNTTEFYNELTRQNDPINAPKFKWNFNLNWDSRFGMIACGYRHVDKFVWQDGIWSGEIGPYDLFDIHYKYKINDYLSTSISCLNVFNNVHRELIGGAKMGRQIIMRFSTEF